MSKGTKILLWTVFGIFIFVGIVVATAEIILHRKVTQLVASITDTPPAPLHIKPGKISYSFVRGSFAVDDLHIETIPNDVSATHVSIDVERLALAGVNFRMQKGGRYRLGVRSASIVSPSVTVNTYSGEMNRQKEDKPRKDIRETFSLLRIREASLTGGSMTYNIRDDRSSVTAGGDAARMSDFTVDQNFTRDKMFDAGLDLSIDSVRYTYNDQEVRIGLDDIALDTRLGSLSAAAFEMLPLKYPKYEYAANVASHSDWTKWNIDSVAVYGIDVARLLSGEGMNVDSVSLVNGTAWSYKNRHVPQEPTTKKLFFLSLHEIGMKLAVRSIALHDFDVTYEELSEHGDTPGAIGIDDINAEFRGLTNVYDGKTEYYTLEAECRFQGSGYNRSVLRLPINHENDHFEIEGRVGTMELAALNPTFVPLSNFEIRSGRIESAEYLISGNDLSSETTITLIYDDLYVELLGKDAAGKLAERKFLTEILDTRILYTSNPLPGQGVRTGKGTFDRDIYRSQYNYIWKSLFSAIKNTVI